MVELKAMMLFHYRLHRNYWKVQFMKRPTGVTILAVLAIIGGALDLLAGFALIALSSTDASATSAAITGSEATILGGAVLVSGILALAFGIGAFMGASWAWIVGIAAEVLNLLAVVANIAVSSSKTSIGHLIGSNLVSIVISVAVLAYLNTANVKAYFKR